MRPRSLADADFNHKIVVGPCRREPSVDFVGAHDAGIVWPARPRVISVGAELRRRTRYRHQQSCGGVRGANCGERRAATRSRRSDPRDSQTRTTFNGRFAAKKFIIACKAFFDTNVLLYMPSTADLLKQVRTQRVFGEYLAAGRIVLSTQVVQEFHAAVSRKIEIPRKGPPG
jgi:hypothetical protein